MQRHARQHKVLFVVAVVVAGGGGAAAAVLAPGSSSTILRFVPGATFALAVIVTNKAAAAITLQQARAVLPRRSPLRQIGTRLIAFEPFVCAPGANCLP